VTLWTVRLEMPVNEGEKRAMSVWVVETLVTGSARDDLIIWAGSVIVHDDCSREQWGWRLNVVGQEEESTLIRRGYHDTLTETHSQVLEEKAKQ